MTVTLALKMGLQLVYDHGPVEEQQSRVQELQLHQDGDAKDDGKLAQTRSTHTTQVQLRSDVEAPTKTRVRMGKFLYLQAPTGIMDTKHAHTTNNLT